MKNLYHQGCQWRLTGKLELSPTPCITLRHPSLRRQRRPTETKDLNKIPNFTTQSQRCPRENKKSFYSLNEEPGSAQLEEKG